jgi:pantothenate kinase-related protein Tda10
MTLLTFLLRLPWFPVQGFVKLASVIKDEAEREMANPVTIRRELEHAERARASGQMSDEQAAEFQDAAFAEFTRARRSTAAASTHEG